LNDTKDFLGEKKKKKKKGWGWGDKVLIIRQYIPRGLAKKIYINDSFKKLYFSLQSLAKFGSFFMLMITHPFNSQN
jgi:hypothetical protein